MKTPMSSDTKLTKDEECELVDSTKYRGMIGSLLYLTASRPDIMFSVFLCAHFQEAPKTSHLEAVKRIFRYIKGDYVDQKSTSGICTFVGCCLTSWFSKKQTALAISTTESEYVSAGKACQQALWMKQALIDYDTLLKFLEYLVRVHVSLVTDDHLMSWYMVPLRKDHIKPTFLLPMISSRILEKIEKVKSLASVIKKKLRFKIIKFSLDHVPACLCYMLYCVANSEKFNLAYFMAKRMEWVTKQARLILPYGMLLTRLFDFIIGENPELQNESYVLYDRVMNPLAAQLERKPRRDHGTRRGRQSTSSSTFDQPSSSHLNDDDDDGNDEGTSRASTPSPIRYVNSLTNQVPQVFQNPPNIDPHLEPFYTRQTEIINRQVQL
ncbi:hypothetical protein Tco_0256384 [Tanacetum coccineum]